jgi:hypothetical protein
VKGWCCIYIVAQNHGGVVRVVETTIVALAIQLLLYLSAHIVFQWTRNAIDGNVVIDHVADAGKTKETCLK